MDFLNELGKTIEQVARQVEEKSGEIWEAGRINIEIFKLEDSIRRLHRKIGEQVSLEFDKGQQFGEQVNEHCSEIRKKKKKIEELKAKLSESKKQEQWPEKKYDKQSDGPQEQEVVDLNEHEKEILKQEEDQPRKPDISYYEAVEKMQKIQQSE